MRERRISRLVLRVEAAIESGAVDAAQEALQELERLEANASDLAAFRRRLAPPPRQLLTPPAAQPAPQLPPVAAAQPTHQLIAQPAPPPPIQVLAESEDPHPLLAESAGPRFLADLELRPPADAGEKPARRRRWLPAAAALFLCGGAIGWFAVPRIRVAPTGDRVSAALAASALQENTTQPNGGAIPENAPPLPTVHVAVDEVAAAETVAEPPPMTDSPRPPAAEALQQPRATAGYDVPSPRPASPAALERTDAVPPPVAMDASLPAAVRPEVPPASVTPLERAPSIPPPASAPPEAALPPPASASSADSVAEPAVTRPVVSEEGGIRSTLARYEAAYSRLDANAAGAVWPGVDRRALARAFDGLASQQVNLGSCDVRVVGETALTDCSGSATWTPKVGGGTRSAARQWQFRLRKASGEWQIVGATAR